jgi:hypothetical protein
MRLYPRLPPIRPPETDSTPNTDISMTFSDKSNAVIHPYTRLRVTPRGWLLLSRSSSDAQIPG